MIKDPWTDPDPQPGDFDEFLRTVDPSEIEFHEGNPDAKVTIMVSVKGEDAARLERIATERGQRVDEVVSDLLRAAKPRAA
jgi:hypothetical protein